MDTAQLDKSLVDLWPLGPVSSYSINTETYIDGERIAITVIGYFIWFYYRGIAAVNGITVNYLK